MKRSWLYRAGAIWGDVNAVRRGTMHKRIYNRLLARLVRAIFPWAQ